MLLVRNDSFGHHNHISNRLFDGGRCDAVCLIVGLLNRAAAFRLRNGAAHGVRHVIGIHNHVPLGISRRTAYGLHERGLRAQEALLVGIQNRDQRNLRDVQTLAEQIDADQHIELIEAHGADDLRALQGVNVRVQIAHPHADLPEVAC